MWTNLAVFCAVRKSQDRKSRRMLMLPFLQSSSMETKITRITWNWTSLLSLQEMKITQFTWNWTMNHRRTEICPMNYIRLEMDSNHHSSDIRCLILLKGTSVDKLLKNAAQSWHTYTHAELQTFSRWRLTYSIITRFSWNILQMYDSYNFNIL